ncbi:hypothetical protein [Aquincola sp. J276]|uniref:hypothetical protein n=1 Tax=Aquincola sp. J276 TaxID=2898432 RepID=UPI002150A1E6|nr:hypothetical protein [Aquincola sp. J276]MCR5868479.1 hypothetical protein [Aquincola sp. J276]
MLQRRGYFAEVTEKRTGVLALKLGVTVNIRCGAETLAIFVIAWRKRPPLDQQAAEMQGLRDAFTN